MNRIASCSAILEIILLCFAVVRLVVAFPYTCDELAPTSCELNVIEGNFTSKGLRVNYWIYTSDGDDEASTSKLPLVLAHGGPGISHDYMLPLKQQACHGRMLVFYDQAGSGRSEHVEGIVETAPWLLDPNYFADELEALIKHLGWRKYHYLGSSWGTILGQIFALRQPPGLSSLVLSGPLSDAKLYIGAQWDPKEGSLGLLPPFIQQRVHALDAERAYDSEEYESLEGTLTSFFTVRVTPLPDCFQQSLERMNKEIYVGMQGPSEFTLGGTLANFNYTGRLKDITIPVLLTSGKYDTMRPPCVRVMYREIPRVEWHVFAHSGHVSMIDDAIEMNEVVHDFLTRVERDAPIGSERSSSIQSDFLVTKYQASFSNGVVAVHATIVLATLFVGCFGGIVVGRRMPTKVAKYAHVKMGVRTEVSN